jgi:D-alanyl-D-alanine carboxypeptidase (penicillin-binding protein 5/6)
VTVAARQAAGARGPATVVSVVLAVALALAAATVRPATAAAATTGPLVRAPAAILVEPATGDVVYQRNARDERPIASTTKLMTALLTLERARLGEKLTAVPYHPAPAESVIGLRAGERLTVADLMRGLLLASANDAAATLAARIGGSRARFVRLMNRRARQLGLHDTHYANPIGLDEAGNHSSAEDLVKLTLILRRNRFFRAVTNLPSATLKTGARPRTIVNRNTLVREVPAVNGVKTGHTSTAGYVLVGSATRKGITVISAVLGEPSEAARDADSLTLLRYGLGRYHRVTGVKRGRAYATAKLAHRNQRLALVATRTVRRTVRRGEHLTTRVVGAPRQVEGPLPAGARVGTIELRWRGRTVDRIALVTPRAVSDATVVERAGGLIGRTLIVLAVAAAALGSLQIVLLRRRLQRRRRSRAGGTEIA